MDLSIATFNLLGGNQVISSKPQSNFEWIEVIREGLPSSSIDRILQLTNLAQAELTKALNLSDRTFARHKKLEVLPSELTAKLIRFARVVARAEEVFGSQDLALEWLKTENSSLNKVTPISLLDTELGAENILQTLGRIEQGVFI